MDKGVSFSKNAAERTKRTVLNSEAFMQPRPLKGPRGARSVGGGGGGGGVIGIGYNTEEGTAAESTGPTSRTPGQVNVDEMIAGEGGLALVLALTPIPPLTVVYVVQIGEDKYAFATHC